MNRRTFLKSTAITLISPTLLLKGDTLQDPLQWIPFSSKFPKNKEIILIGEKCETFMHYKFIPYNIGVMVNENEANVGKLFFTDNKRTGKRKYTLLRRLNEKWEPYIYQINKNSCYWITIKNLLKYMKNKPINKSNINIIEIKQYHNCCGIYVGKITNVHKKEIEITGRYKFPSLSSSNKNSIAGWTEIPNLPNNSMAI